MKYYVTSDIHGFYDEFISALDEAGYFSDNGPRRLIVCGDIFDRGPGAVRLQAFIAEQLDKEQAILIRGNHEDLAMEMIEDMQHGYIRYHHNQNGTTDTVCQLLGLNPRELFQNLPEKAEQFRSTPFVSRIIPAMADYFETERYIFVHGWIPCDMSRPAFSQFPEYHPLEDWRNSPALKWQEARWTNGMEAARSGVLEPGKTIVCGHWHSSFGHSVYEGRGSEFGSDADRTPYRAEGIIALDACTALSGKVNCVVLED